jgi:hypothetical protein
VLSNDIAVAVAVAEGEIDDARCGWYRQFDARQAARQEPHHLLLPLSISEAEGYFGLNMYARHHCLPSCLHTSTISIPII